MDPAAIWRDYAYLVAGPLVLGTVLLVIASLVRATVGWWLE
jgi:hypothetical protein